MAAPSISATPGNGTATELEYASRSRVARVAIDSLLIARRSLKRIPRQPDWLVFATIQPLMFIILFRYIFGGTVQFALPGGVRSEDFLITGIIVQTVVFGTTSTAIGLAEDLKKGLMDRFRALPMTRSSVLIGRILADLALNVFVTTISIMVGLAVGFRPDWSLLNWLGAITVLLFISLAFSWVGAWIGLTLKTLEAVQSGGLIWIFPLTFASSAFVPIETMPGWLQPFAENQPFTLAVNSVRGFLTGYPDVGSDAVIAILWCVAIMAIFIPLSVRAYERRTSS